MSSEMIRRIRYPWEQYLVGGLPIPSSNEKIQQVKLINSFSVVGCASLLIFGIAQLTTSPINGIIELTIGILGIVNIATFRYHKNIGVASSIILAFMIVVLALLLTTGGIANTGIFWIYTFPVLAFFLKGKKWGLGWMAMFMIVYAVITYGNVLGYWTLPYEIIVMRQLFLSFIAVSALTYFYQSVNEMQNEIIKEQTQNILGANEQLKRELHEHYKKPRP